MSRLEEHEAQWLQRYSVILTRQALQAAPTLPENQAPSAAQITTHNQQLAAYNANPIRQLLNQLQTRPQYSGIRAVGVNEDGTLRLEGGNVRDQSLFQAEFTTLRQQSMNAAVNGSGFNLEGIIRPPVDLSANGVAGMLSNPGAIGGRISSMLNPLNWIGNMFEVAWTVASQIPFIDNLVGGVKEMLSGREFSTDRGRVRQAAERMFAYLQPQQRTVAVEGLMNDYVASGGQLPQTPGTGGTNQFLASAPPGAFVPTPQGLPGSGPTSSLPGPAI